MKHDTIKKHKDFITSLDTTILRSGNFTLKIKPASNTNGAHYGIVASKRFFRLAVERNRAKRLLRDWLAFNEDLMNENFDYIFMAEHGILNVKREEGRQEMANVLKKVSDKKHAFKKQS